jgi:hypothetical protein
MLFPELVAASCDNILSVLDLRFSHVVTLKDGIFRIVTLCNSVLIHRCLG